MYFFTNYLVSNLLEHSAFQFNRDEACYYGIYFKMKNKIPGSWNRVQIWLSKLYKGRWYIYIWTFPLTKCWVARAQILNTRGSQQDSYQKFADIKGLIRSRKSKQHNTLASNKKDKRTNNDLQNKTQKTKDRATRTPLKIGGDLGCLWIVSSSSSTCEIRRVAVKQHKHNLIWKSCWTPVYVNRHNINKTF